MDYEWIAELQYLTIKPTAKFVHIRKLANLTEDERQQLTEVELKEKYTFPILGVPEGITTSLRLTVD